MGRAIKTGKFCESDGRMAMNRVSFPEKDTMETSMWLMTDRMEEWWEMQVDDDA